MFPRIPPPTQLAQLATAGGLTAGGGGPSAGPINWRGAWNVLTLYQPNDGVTRDDGSFVARVQNVGVMPVAGVTSATWQLIAQGAPPPDLDDYPTRPEVTSEIDAARPNLSAFAMSADVVALETALAAHAGDPGDPHPQYMPDGTAYTKAEGDAKYATQAAVAGKADASSLAAHATRALLDADIPATIARDSEVTAAVSAHAAVAAPHSGHEVTSAKGQANGYASLGADGKVPGAQLPASGAAALRSTRTTPLTVGTAAADVFAAVALAAGTRYQIYAVINYRNGTTTAVHAGRATYSGTLNATADHTSVASFMGTSGAPAVWAALFRMNTLAVNATMPATAGGPGNTGSTTAVAQIIVAGVISTNAAGNFNVAMISSAASGLVVLAGSTLELWAL